jgi:hypothetical protein
MAKLLSVCHERVTDACGCFSFQNFLFQVQINRVLAKKITFLFSHKIGFMAWYNKTYHPVSLLGFSNRRGDIHVPDVTKALLHRHYLTDGKSA